MSGLLTDVTDLAGYAEPGTAPKYLDTLHIAREYSICRDLAKFDAPRSSATVGKPPAITDSTLVWMYASN